MPLVEIRDVRKEFPARSRGGSPTVAVDGVDLDVEAGEIFGIVGYSGAGKSTLVRLVNALEPATSGSIRVDGTEIVGLGERSLQRVRRDIGMIFQQFNLMNSRTVYGNIAFPLQVAGVPKSEHRKRISELLHFVGLADKALAYPDQLSGGQKQRVGIARALATSPKLLLADEATSALDPETTQEVLALLKQVNTELGITIVLITHEMEVIKTIADKVAVMEDGKVIEQGPVFDLFSRPQHPATRRFVSTLVADQPPERALQVLRERHDGRFVTLAFRDPAVRQSQVFAELISRDVAFELVYGGIEDIQGETFGNLTLSLTGDPTQVEAALGAVRALVDVREVAA
ncbi:methionine ABC transporter ATP-binding protein [Nocardioides lianchengensis]|uniref:D-methionine transport system ATP-binding protein n=1 Tax=Nocardioides lianchengensis TaxID=1045774 RepID=A0A1G6TV32_9ACTN|nr:methionine ABC transporter ATP-binding protein [Nocardioides lianchengensis]NYG11629.1 D-methionine transport system ATP-binding protein [Nocardioides lianchengensis]SDD32943.1 D-methionine transport system ATP-binding protein [Nocardioides lianchengensis]